MDIQHDVRQRKFYTILNENEYTLEYNEVAPDLWEFHCAFIPAIVTKLKEIEIQEQLIDYALHYMARNNIRLFEGGSCFHVKDYLDKKRDIQFLIKYVV